MLSCIYVHILSDLTVLQNLRVSVEHISREAFILLALCHVYSSGSRNVKSNLGQLPPDKFNINKLAVAADAKVRGSANGVELFVQQQLIRSRCSFRKEKLQPARTQVERTADSKQAALEKTSY